tara:strand:+ start:1853 stop:2341 length:489 start_codon:yes stop_codon:yes gene_type:complete
MAVNEYQGARSYIDLIERLRDICLNNKSITTVSLGDLSEVDLDKQTIYPLAHIMINTANFSSTIITYDVNILFMDVVHSDTTENEAVIYNNDNEIFVLNTMLNVGNHVTDIFNSGSLNDGNTRIKRETVTAEPFKDRFENLVAGWAFSFQIETRNNIDRCLT